MKILSKLENMKNIQWRTQKIFMGGRFKVPKFFFALKSKV